MISYLDHNVHMVVTYTDLYISIGPIYISVFILGSYK